MKKFLLICLLSLGCQPEPPKPVPNGAMFFGIEKFELATDKIIITYENEKVSSFVIDENDDVQIKVGGKANWLEYEKVGDHNKVVIHIPSSRGG